MTLNMAASQINPPIYIEKIEKIGSVDPYQLDNSFYSITDKKLWPQITYLDLVNYFVFSTSTYTQDEIKAYKSLQSYSYFIAGWVLEIGVGKLTQDLYLIKAKVCYPLSLHHKPGQLRKPGENLHVSDFWKGKVCYIFNFNALIYVS